MIEAVGPSPKDGVEDVNCSEAAQLLDVLSPRYEPLWKDDAAAWIFRGQSNADWDLQPTAIRDPSLFAKYGVLRSSAAASGDHNGDIDWSERVDLLNDMLVRFREGLDRSGLVIPAPSPRVTSREWMTVSTSAAPPKDAWPLMALARHHGLPTLFLDWTRRSWVAAYFAAVGAADRDEHRESKHLAVWALYRKGPVDSNEVPLFYEAPGGANPNLAAQDGLFTFHSSEGDLSLEQHCHNLRGEGKYAPELRRITLPIAQAGRLLQLLAEEGIHGASMFPGATGVVQAMRESALMRT